MGENAITSNAEVSCLLSGADLPLSTLPNKEIFNLISEPEITSKDETGVSEPDTFLDPLIFESQLNSDTRKNIGRMLAQSSPSATSTLTTRYLPSIIAFVSQIKREFENNPTPLLQLNSSRREAIVKHLERIAGTPSGPSSLQHDDAITALRRWLTPPRSSTQNAALSAYFEEIALFAICQILVLKAWSDRGIRPLHEEDLGRLNAILNAALKNHTPLGREGWQATQKNLYSWYNPPVHLQKDIWKIISNWNFSEEGSAFLATLMDLSRQNQPAWPELIGYDTRFYSALWKNSTAPCKTAFSPTLRNGAIVQAGPESVNWIGLDNNPFQLFISEFVQLWWGPKTPSDWAIGTGLEVHPRDQLQLTMPSAKPSIFARIAEMEACEYAFVFEERVIRANGRSNESLAFKDQLNELEYFKKLRSASVAMGPLQACTAITKLRPGGYLWWAREEALSSLDGQEALKFILEKAKLVCEWDFSHMEHSLPSSKPLFAKYLYCFQKEQDANTRRDNRPFRVVLSGQIRSHVEIQAFMDDSLSAFQRKTSGRSHWNIHVHQSPIPQREWMDRWPEVAIRETVQALDTLQLHSVPLASLATVRSLPDFPTNVPHNYPGIWISASRTNKERKLYLYPLGCVSVSGIREKKEGPGLLLLFADKSWIAPLMQYLQSIRIKDWLEHHAERRGENWLLTEQLIKYLPIHKALIKVIDGGYNNFSAQENALINLLPEKRAELLSILKVESHSETLLAALFAKTANSIMDILDREHLLFDIVTDMAKIRWKALFEILPQNDFISVSVHPEMQISGQLGLHQPIGRFERIKTPKGFLFSTETGNFLTLSSDNSVLLDMIGEQLEGLKHPTWSELVQTLKIPRRTETMEAAANDLIKKHANTLSKIMELDKIANDSVFF